MDNWLKRTWVIRIVSLVMAILLYTAVTLSENQYQSEARVDENDLGTSDEAQVVEDVLVNIKIDDDKSVSGVPDTVTVTLEGPNSIATPVARQRNFDVFVDLQGLEPGTHMVDILHSGISESLTAYIEPGQVEVTIEERASESFDVTLEYLNQNELPAGFELGDATISPAQVVITSSKSIVDKISIVKAFVDLRDADETIRLNEVPIKVYDNQGNELNVRVEPSTVEITVDINSPNSLVPVEATTTGEIPEGYYILATSTRPGEVRVYASEEDLNNLDKLKTEPIDLSQITETTTIEVPLTVPGNVRKVDQEQVSVTIEIAQMVERTIENVPITVENLDENAALSFVSPNEGVMNITVVGAEEIVNNLELDDIQLSINAAELQSGEHTIPIKMNAPDNVTIQLPLEDADVLIE
ncbi:YbbR-like domain-containing protein [Radiobacillus sp. PE A8.2]|uniref:CdaR family protein n=1 Tax=Radiobacillus sp. PE A8.2 TaxID=3380349 RepID=UPI00388E6DD0